MSEQILRQILCRLPKGEHFKKTFMLRDDIRLISEDDLGQEYVYKVSFMDDGTIRLTKV